MMRLASPGSPPVLCWEELGSGEGQPLPAAAYHQLEEGLYQHLKECFAQRRFSAAQQLAQRIVRLDMANTPDINIQRLRAGRADLLYFGSVGGTAGGAVAGTGPRGAAAY